jgi:hypothetical protein
MAESFSGWPTESIITLWWPKVKILPTDQHLCFASKQADPLETRTHAVDFSMIFGISIETLHLGSHNCFNWQAALYSLSLPPGKVNS